MNVYRQLEVASRHVEDFDFPHSIGADPDECVPAIGGPGAFRAGQESASDDRPLDREQTRSQEKGRRESAGSRGGKGGFLHNHVFCTIGSRGCP